MKRLPRRVALLFLASIATAFVVFRIWWMPDLLVRQMADPSPNGTERPTDVGMSYADASFEVDGDRLDAWLVEVPDAKPMAFLLLKGAQEVNSQWIPVQKLLHDRGYPSLVFDFAGKGDSEGQPSARNNREQPRRALAELLERLPSESDVVILGHSVGASQAVMAFHDYNDPRLRGLVVNAGVTTFRDFLVEVGGLPRPVAWLFPQLLNAETHIADVSVPLLVIGSESDEATPPALVRQLFARASEPKELVMWEAHGHNALLDATDEWWEPVFAWIERLERSDYSR